MPIERINPDSLPQPGSLYSMISLAPVGTRLAAISGQLGWTAGADPKTECLATFSAVRKACGSIGAEPADILHMRTLLVGRDMHEAFVAARAEVFAEWYGAAPPPSSTLAFVSGLAHPEARCEVEVLVAIG